jgi:hypothetical protein
VRLHAVVSLPALRPGGARSILPWASAHGPRVVRTHLWFLVRKPRRGGTRRWSPHLEHCRPSGAR